MGILALGSVRKPWVALLAMCMVFVFAVGCSLVDDDDATVTPAATATGGTVTQATTDAAGTVAPAECIEMLVSIIFAL